MDIQVLMDICLEEGAARAAVIEVAQIPFDKGLRAYCAANACGSYGKNWACPPGVGEPDEVIARARQYRYALVFQAVGQMEDSFDFEGMEAAGRRFGETAERIRSRVADQIPGYLLLTAGGCSVCPVCAKVEDKPCRFPDKAISSLEAYCMQVSRLRQPAACPITTAPTPSPTSGRFYFIDFWKRADGLFSIRQLFYAAALCYSSHRTIRPCSLVRFISISR